MILFKHNDMFLPVEDIENMSKMTVNGVSTTKGKDQYQVERFYNRTTKRYLYQWDYRDAEGILHSGVTKTIQAAAGQAYKFGYRG